MKAREKYAEAKYNFKFNVVLIGTEACTVSKLASMVIFLSKDDHGVGMCVYIHIFFPLLKKSLQHDESALPIMH